MGIKRALRVFQNALSPVEIETTPPPSQLCHVYCDESRQTAERFMVLGGAAIEDKDEKRVAEIYNAFRVAHNMTKEMKWTHVTRDKLDSYKAFVDVFFPLMEVHDVGLHTMIIDTHQVDHRKFNQGNKELGFYKFFYQFLLHSFGKNYCRGEIQDRIRVFMDARNSSYSLLDLKNILNNGMKKKYQNKNNPFRTVEPVDSKASTLLQFVDVIIGAIGYQKNGYHTLPGASPAKTALIQHILMRAKLTTLTNDTPYKRRNFTIWNFRLQPR